MKRKIYMLKSVDQRADATNLKGDCKLNVSPRIIRRHLRVLGMQYKNVQRRINLTKAHKEKRVEMAKQWISSNHDMSKTIFSDEKRFSLDGPDNWKTYVCKKQNQLNVIGDNAKEAVLWFG